MSKFIFAVSGQVLDLLTPTKGISDTINANSAEFNFRSPEWQNAEKWAHFSNPDYNDGASIDFNLINDVIDPSRGLNLPSGIWEVWVHGEIIENGEVTRRYVTETQTIQIIESNAISNAPLGELDPSVAEQIDAKATAALKAYNAINGKLIPSGGTTGQILVKRSDVDQDVEWADITDLISSVNG